MHGQRVKRLPALYSTLALVGPLLVIAALLAGPFGCGGSGGGGATPVPTMGSLEIGFVDSPSNAFQAIALNIVSVRLNPSTVAVPDTDPNWVSVTAPPASGPGELSVNLLDFQNDAVVFNIGKITAQTYFQVEVVFDAALPGMVIPSCTSGTQEGCITANASFTGSTNVVTTAAGGVQVTSGGLTPLIIDINPGTPAPPAAPGGNYTLNPSITVAPTGTFLATVSGTVSGVSAVSGDTINAELTGTNSIVATAPIPASGAYSIQLPAGVNGTTYDLFVSSTTGSTTFGVVSGLTLTRGGVTPPAQNFSVTAPGTATTIAGTVIDARTHNALVGATVNLLLPQESTDNCMASMTGCVIVSTTTSNSAGIYTFSSPSPPGGTLYYVQAIMTGTQTQTLPVTFSGTVGICPGGANPNNCSFNLNNVLITGNIVVDPPPAAGTNIVVTVIAEQTGTGNLVGLTQATVNATGSTMFNMEVPPTPPNVDLIASAQDAYLGIGTHFSGHQLAVAPNVVPNGTTPVATLTVSCMGHGTIAGVANSSDAGTHVRLFQNGVQLMDSTVGSTVPVPGATSPPPFPNQYSFCAPPNTYSIQRFEVTGSVASPVGPSQPITVPIPAPTPTSGPCPLCQNAGGQCPGNCTATTASPL
jgi:Domain of unknown function (DUF4382)